MASSTIKWHLSILMVTLLPVFAVEGPPAPPAPPKCVLPCDATCTVNLHCMWHHKADAKIPTNYSLHWQSPNDIERSLTSGPQLNGVILREHAPRDEELRVWVQARNQYGFAKSEESIINPEEIIKPPSPKLSPSHLEPLEIEWSTACEALGYSVGICEVRHQTEEDGTWWELETGLHITYTLMDSRPGTVYTFQVRCSCSLGVMSDWSEPLEMKSRELAPVGKVNIWRDCGIFPSNSDCFLIWKSLPGRQARGVILGYQVRVSYSDGTAALFNESTRGPSEHFVHDENNWCLSTPLNDVSSVSVTANNALGATLPSYLEMPLKGKEETDRTIRLDLNEENLTVWLDLPSQLSANHKEFVVQFKEAGRPGGRGFDWIRVNQSQAVQFTGQFKNYTAYQVSVFAISRSGAVHFLSSVIGYSLEKAPPEVSTFQVSSIEGTEVSLVWEPPPLTEQNGLILNYEIGVNAEKVHKVPATLQHSEFKLEGLQAGQEYEVWIRAVNAAGPGPKVTRSFNTKLSNHSAILSALLMAFGICSLIVLCACLVYKSSQFFKERVPDPNNSCIFQKMTYQFKEPCHSIPETNPKMSLLEVVERPSQSTDLDGLPGPAAEDGSVHPDGQKEEDSSPRKAHDSSGSRCERKEYSEMVDSDEGECSSGEEQSTSGYEQHFMPTAMDIMDV